MEPARRVAAEQLRTRLGVSREAAEQLRELSDLPSPIDLAYHQIEDAIARGQRDFSGAPCWCWGSLHHMVGPMLPGEFWVVGALMGNGKTSFLLSQLDQWATEQLPILFLPLEMDPADLRRRWAAWRLGLDPVAVARNEWDRLGRDAQAAHERMMVQLGQSPTVQFPGERRVTVDRLAKWITWSVREIGARVVLIDHLHRMELDAQHYRIAITEAVRAIKDLAREHQLVIVASAQLNQHSDDALDRYFPPSLRRLKESAGIAEEADVVLMLSRRLKAQLTKQEMLEVRTGHRSERDFADPGAMAVTCRKHRLADAVAGDRTTVLRVANGRVIEDDPWLHRGSA